MSLTNCLRKLGKNISAEDKTAIQTAATALRKQGMAPDEAARAAVIERMAQLEQQAEAIKSAPPPKPAAAPPAKPAEAAGKPGEGVASDQFVAAEAEAVAQATPDMLVMMEGMEAPVKVSDLLAEVMALAKQEVADAPLVKVAAECALRG